MKKLSILYLFIVSLNIIFAQNPVTIHVATVENTITPYLYGSCIEDVNHEIYGGLYDQKIFGESFEEDSQSMSFDEFDDYGGNWSVSSSALSVTADDGSKLLHHSSFSDGSIEVEMI